MKLDKKILIVIALGVVAALSTSYLIGSLIVSFASQEALREKAPAESYIQPSLLVGEAPSKPVAVTKTVTAATTITGMQDYSVEAAGRLLIKTANLRLEAEDPEAAANEISTIVESYGGYIARLSISGEEKKSVVMTVRVPEDSFYDALNAIRRVGEVISEEVNVRDVTEQHVDLEARLRNLRAEEEWLLAAVDKAKSVQDLIMIEKELWRVRGEIERIEAQLKNLERMTAYSTISIWIKAPEKPKPKPSPYPEIDFTPVLVAAVTALIYIAYGLVFLAIVGIPVGLIAYAGYAIYRKTVKKRKT